MSARPARGRERWLREAVPSRAAIRALWGRSLWEASVVIPWNQDNTRATYDEVADTYADHFTSTQPELPLDLAMVDHFVAQLREPRRTLDAGCGAGRMMPYLASRGCRVEGVDLSERMIQRARRDHPEFPAQMASLSQLPFGDATFDGVLSWYSTIHSPDEDVAGMLTEMRRVLLPGGLALLGFQTGEQAREVGGGYRRRGHEVVLMRFGREVPWMCERLTAAGLSPIASLARGAAGDERDGQGIVVARAQ